jgi:hypothetical protein
MMIVLFFHICLLFILYISCQTLTLTGFLNILNSNKWMLDLRIEFIYLFKLIFG